MPVSKHPFERDNVVTYLEPARMLPKLWPSLPIQSEPCYMLLQPSLEDRLPSSTRARRHGARAKQALEKNDASHAIIWLFRSPFYLATSDHFHLVFRISRRMLMDSSLRQTVHSGRHIGPLHTRRLLAFHTEPRQVSVSYVHDRELTQSIQSSFGI
jgi:hypothetical protein